MRKAKTKLKEIRTVTIRFDSGQEKEIDIPKSYGWRRVRRHIKKLSGKGVDNRCKVIKNRIKVKKPEPYSMRSDKKRGR